MVSPRIATKAVLALVAVSAPALRQQVAAALKHNSNTEQKVIMRIPVSALLTFPFSHPFSLVTRGGRRQSQSQGVDVNDRVVGGI